MTLVSRKALSLLFTATGTDSTRSKPYVHQLIKLAYTNLFNLHNILYVVYKLIYVYIFIHYHYKLC